MDRNLVRPQPKDVKAYYAVLQAYAKQKVKHEGALRSAFQNLLAATGRRVGWTLIPDLTIGSIRPDGTFRDDYHLKHGYWEAKDTGDNLQTEIQKKIAKGYPLTNIIFEDTQQAYLFQNGKVAMQVDLTQPQQLVNLLVTFFSYTEPAHEDFNTAVEEFKQRVPDLAYGLVQKIQEAHKTNANFKKAFESFFALCKNSLNPNLRVEAVDEMLVQHLLTERLISTIFDNPDFTRRNVIAREVEKVIDALVSKSFNRHEFLKSLDPFYLAIESAAQTIQDFSEKQHFLNTVYERFFQGYSVKVADTHGIVYTPQEIVGFMCASVAEVLQSEFGKSLGDKNVNILDPCTGTGNFIANLLRLMPKRDLPRMYRDQMFANEIMLLPYYIAALNIEHTYYELTGMYEPFEGLCFVDTLELTEGDQGLFSFMTEENTARVQRQKKAPITVIIANPPYNVGQINENDNNKNRKYPVIDGRIRDTYAKDSRATLNTKLYDPYVKFFCWAIGRLEGRDGIVCLVTNNSFVDLIAFDGMRKHLVQDFTRLYHIDLHGDVRENPKLSGTTHNVFGIQLGVGITVAIRKAQHADHMLFYHRVPEDWRKEEKLNWLKNQQTVSAVTWQKLQPDDRHSWLIPKYAGEFSAFLPMGTKETKSANSRNAASVFSTYSLGVSTNRDDVVYDFQQLDLQQRIEHFCDDYSAEVDRYQRKGIGTNLDDFLDYSKKIKWSRNLKRHLQSGDNFNYNAGNIRHVFYRPFTKRHLYFADIAVDELGQCPKFFPGVSAEQENKVICCTNHTQKSFSVQITNSIPDAAVGGRAGQCFPFYVYDEEGRNRRENITDWAPDRFRDHYSEKKITKWDIFYYVYGMLHHPGYRERFADNLKRDLPRIPFAADFWAFAAAGKKLAQLHLDYEKIEPYPLKWIETPGVPLSYRVSDKMRLSGDKTSLKVNDSLTLGGIPLEVFQYRLGNRSALEWIVDQYQVSQDERSGIRSDPNRPDDEDYIVRLVGQVVRVSSETMSIVQGLPASFQS
ncbi:MAG: N-6 DNA methylase [Deltaproteobacteria bacterium]|nr:N-6 DNA methylase [Deltaproteobacteria bacterium]